MRLRVSEKQILSEIIFGLMRRLNLDSVIISDIERERRRWESKYFEGLSLDIKKSKDNDIIVEIKKGQ